MFRLWYKPLREQDRTFWRNRGLNELGWLPYGDTFATTEAAEREVATVKRNDPQGWWKVQVMRAG